MPVKLKPLKEDAQKQSILHAIIFEKSKFSDVTVIVCVGNVSPLIMDNCVAI